MKRSRPGSQRSAIGRYVLAAGAAILGLEAGSASAGEIFDLGAAWPYAVLFEGTNNHQLSITNVSLIGNIGVANTGHVADSGPSTIKGRIDFAAPDTGQFSNSNASNIITDGVNYNVSGVNTAMSYVNTLSQTLFNINATNVAINGTTTINSADGTLVTINGQQVRLFDVTSFTNGGGDILTVNANDPLSSLVAFNFKKASDETQPFGNVQFHGDVQLTGGLGIDSVLFNIGGGDYTTNTGAGQLNFNNNKGANGYARGIFLDPNGDISFSSGYVVGRVFGSGDGNYQFVSNSSIVVPVPPAALGGAALAAGLGLTRIRRRKEASL